MTTERPEQSAGFYRGREREFRDQAALSQKRVDRLVHLRLISFLVLAVAFAAAAAGGEPQLVLKGVGTLGLFVFLTAVVLHERAQVDLIRSRQMVRVNRYALARIERRWDDMDPAAAEPLDRQDPVARDLDLFGRCSLFRLLCTAQSQPGTDTLRSWLLHRADPSEVVLRQSAVAELAPQIDLRQEFELRGRLMSLSLARPDTLVEWTEQEPWLAPRRLLRTLSWAMPFVLLVLTTVVAFGGLTPVGGGAAAALFLVVNIFISIAYIGPIHGIFDRVSSKHGEAAHYAELFAMITRLPFHAERLKGIQEVLGAKHHEASREMKRLARIMNLASMRRGSLMGFFYFFMQVILLWDVHVLASLEQWQRACRGHARKWFQAIGELEAICSLAALAHDNPDWQYPDIDETGPAVFQASGLGHPLLSDAERVANDVRVGPPGGFLLVTGSNMSGKSTLLRAMGLNAVLAHTGGVACAAQLRMPPLEVASSMRIQDSLEDHISHYLAELMRLKEVVEQAQQCTQRKDRVLLFLLDEILQGTNSAERYIAVQRVLEHLLEHQAIGAISTHDLSLAEGKGLKHRCQTVHFRESFESRDGRETMCFDYRLRDGVAQTTNALKLLELVGLG